MRCHHRNASPRKLGDVVNDRSKADSESRSSLRAGRRRGLIPGPLATPESSAFNATMERDVSRARGTFGEAKVTRRQAPFRVIRSADRERTLTKSDKERQIASI